ncbi:MAG TPA: hypothetical protein VK157_02030 [Phycisphaerales bacterium]|nr:hypothetical protein [Phycisphaerales bacterium]
MKIVAMAGVVVACSCLMFTAVNASASVPVAQTVVLATSATSVSASMPQAAPLTLAQARSDQSSSNRISGRSSRGMIKLAILGVFAVVGVGGWIYRKVTGDE